MQIHPTRIQTNYTFEHKLKDCLLHQFKFPLVRCRTQKLGPLVPAAYGNTFFFVAPVVQCLRCLRQVSWIAHRICKDAYGRASFPNCPRATDMHNKTNFRVAKCKQRRHHFLPRAAPVPTKFLVFTKVYDLTFKLWRCIYMLCVRTWSTRAVRPHWDTLRRRLLYSYAQLVMYMPKMHWHLWCNAASG